MFLQVISPESIMNIWYFLRLAELHIGIFTHSFQTLQPWLPDGWSASWINQFPGIVLTRGQNLQFFFWRTVTAVIVTRIAIGARKQEVCRKALNFLDISVIPRLHYTSVDRINALMNQITLAPWCMKSMKFRWDDCILGQWLHDLDKVNI